MANSFITDQKLELFKILGWRDSRYFDQLILIHVDRKQRPNLEKTERYRYMEIAIDRMVFVPLTDWSNTSQFEYDYDSCPLTFGYSHAYH